MQDHRVNDHELLQAAPTWIIRGSVVAVAMTLLVQLVAAIGAPAAATPEELALLALLLVAPVPALPTLTSLFRYRMGPDLRVAAEASCLAAVACAGMLLTRSAGAPPEPLLASGRPTELALTATLVVSAVAAGALRCHATVVARRSGHPTRTTTVTTHLVVAGLSTLVLAHVAAGAGAGSTAAAVGVVASAVTAAAALAGAAAVEVMHTVRERDRRAHALRMHLAELEQAAHDQRRKRHELSNSVATIAMASSLLHQTPDLPAATRFRLEEMLEREAEHLTDLVAPPRPAVATTPAPALVAAGASTVPDLEVVDLDRTLAPLVLARHGAGTEIAWSPCGLQALGAAEEIATVVAALLDRARAEAPGAPVTIHVQQVDDTVRVAICQRDARRRRRARGRPGARAGGNLADAHALLGARGGRLTFERTDRGATFTIGLPAPRRGVPTVPAR